MPSVFYVRKSKTPIRMDFEGEEAARFLAVKKHLGLSQNTEVIRALISNALNVFNEVSTPKDVPAR